MREKEWDLREGIGLEVKGVKWEAMEWDTIEGSGMRGKGVRWEGEGCVK